MARATAERNRRARTTDSVGRSGYARSVRPDRSSPPPFEPASRIEVARPLPARTEAECHPAPKQRVFSGAELRVIAILIFIVSAVALSVIGMAAKAAETQIEINDLKRSIAQTEDDITAIKIDIKQSQNIEMIRARAETELGMKQPGFDQYIYVADLPIPDPDFAAFIREKAYGSNTSPSIEE